MIVVDASVIVTALVDDGVHGTGTRNRLVAEQLLAPHLIDVEIVSALRRLATAERLGQARAGQAVNDLQAMRIRRVDHRNLVGRAWELRESFTTFDATYVALAEQTGLTLVTGDAKLANTPDARCPIELL